MTDVITIQLTGVQAYGYHGVLAHEREQGQTFVVDATIQVPKPASDDVSDTISYADVAALICQHIEGEPVQLIETLASNIGQAIIADGRCLEVSVTVHKPHAPIPAVFEDVSVNYRTTAQDL